MPADRFVFTGPVPDEDLATLLPQRAASTSRSPSTKGSACRCSRRWPPTCRCWPTASTAVPDTLGGRRGPVHAQGSRVRRRAARRAGLRRRRCEHASSPGSAGASTISATPHPQALEALDRWRVQSLDPAGRYGAPIVKIAFRRSALRRRDPRRIRIPLPADRRAAGRCGIEVEVLTTCARDYITWKNDYPEGSDRIRGVTVRRFANASHARDIGAFNRYSDWIFANDPPHARRRAALARDAGAMVSGVVGVSQAAPPISTTGWSSSLICTPRRHWAGELDPSRAILVPPPHDEPAIHLGLYQDMFRLPAAIAFNTESRRTF